MKKIQTLLISIAAFLLIWFYIQPFAADVDQIVDDVIYTSEEREYDAIMNDINRRKFVRDSLDQRYFDSVSLEYQKRDDSLAKVIFDKQ
jgi:hypothetical protein